MVTKFLCILYNVIINHINEIIITPHLYCPTAIDDFESASAFIMASFACNSETSLLTDLISSRRVNTLTGRSSALTWQKTRSSHVKEELRETIRAISGFSCIDIIGGGRGSTFLKSGRTPEGSHSCH